jgi:hypothetical protein
MNSEESSDQQGVLTGEDQRYILIIGGIEVFLPSSPVEAKVCVAEVATEDRQPTETVMEEEMEQTLTFSRKEEDEHSTEWLKIFSQEAGQEITVVLEAAEEAEEEEADNMDFVDLYEELEALEKRVIVQSLHIQQIKLEADGGAYQPQEQLGKVGLEPTQREMVVAELPQEEAEQQFSEETAELESAAEWPLSATERNKDSRGDQVDLPTEMKELQQRGLHKESQPWEQLDKVIEEIRRLMLSSAAETASNERLSRRKPTRAAGKKKQQQQQQHSWKGADGQLQGKVWDPGGFQSWRKGAHDQEIMIFPAEEYDAGASLQLSISASQQAHPARIHEKERRNPLIFQFLKLNLML